ncbi:hypothetical protein AGR8A_Cc40636 [Agrobacterium fabrum str. J-07]|nr:hypothetical protein AGR8A_Cc40636 [Agrobacterium fabrum str. J-07]
MRMKRVQDSAVGGAIVAPQGGFGPETAHGTLKGFDLRKPRLRVDPAQESLREFREEFYEAYNDDCRRPYDERQPCLCRRGNRGQLEDGQRRNRRDRPLRRCLLRDAEDRQACRKTDRQAFRQGKQLFRRYHRPRQ